MARLCQERGELSYDRDEIFIVRPCSIEFDVQYMGVHVFFGTAARTRDFYPFHFWQLKRYNMCLIV